MTIVKIFTGLYRALLFVVFAMLMIVAKDLLTDEEAQEKM